MTKLKPLKEKSDDTMNYQFNFLSALEKASETGGDQESYNKEISMLMDGESF